MDPVKKKIKTIVTGKVDQKSSLQTFSGKVCLFSWILDEKGFILSFNKAVTEYLGFENKELTGRNIFSTGILDADCKDELLKVPHQPGSKYQIIMTLTARAGIKIKVLLMAEKISIPDKVCILLSALDVSHHDPNNISFIQNKENSEKIRSRQNNIFAIIAHDLRSPFNTILGYCDLLAISLSDKEPDKSIKYNKIIHDSAAKTLKFLNQLLEWGRMQQGQLKFNPESFAIESHVNEVIRLTEFQAETKEIRIKVRLHPGLIAFGDINMFRTILINLITNGIKFGNPGGTILISAKGVQGGTVFVVTDNGIGISPENLAVLFSREHPVSSNGTSMEQGSGFGLSVCKDFIEMHHGKIWAESVPGKGSKFKFFLPS